MITMICTAETTQPESYASGNLRIEHYARCTRPARDTRRHHQFTYSTPLDGQRFDAPVCNQHKTQRYFTLYHAIRKVIDG